MLVVATPRAGASQTAIQYVYDELGRLIAVVDPSGDAAVYTYDAVGNVLSIDRYASSQVSVISFSPGVGPVGTTVAIQGTGFSATANENTVEFNGTAATISSATPTELVVTVPSGATTGAIEVTSPSGSDTSAAEFTVTSPTGPSISSFTPTIGLAGTSVTIEGTGFEATPSNDLTRLNITLAGVTAASSTELTATMPLYAGSGRLSVTTPTGTAVSTGDFIVPPAPYTASDVASSGRLAFADPTTVTVSTANKIGLALFDGTANQRVSLVGTNGLSGQVAGCDVNTSIMHPANSVFVSGTCMEGTGIIDVRTLPTTGTYTVMVDPSSTATGSVTLTLYEVADVVDTITAGGSSETVSITTPGQNGILTFFGTDEQRVSLRGTNGSISGHFFGCDVQVSILDPDGTLVPPETCMEGSGFTDVLILSATGTHMVFVDPQNWATGDLTLTLYDVPDDFSDSITAGGSSVTVAITAPGQNGTLTFSGTTDQQVSLRGTSGTISGQVAGCDVQVSILNPDTSVLAAATCMEGSGFIDTKTLPSTGTYTIVINPLSFATGNLPLTLYNISDATGTITAGGSSETVTISNPGQNGTLSFSGTSGDRISLQRISGTISGQIAGCDVNVSILNPDSSVLASATCMETSGFIDTKTLPSTGTYTIVVDPVSFATGTLTLTLHSVPADATTTLTVNGGSDTLTTTMPGQNAQATFAGTASQQVTVHLTSNSMGSTTVRLLKPDASVLTSKTSSASSFDLTTQTLPTTGTYTIDVDPGGTNVGSITVSVTSP
jgi:YD repeat-containing protein